MMTTETEHVADAPETEGNDVFSTTQTFDDLGLRDSVLKGIRASGFEHPTGIQAQLIPVALTGRDILGQAKTGTGKTAAFALPLLHMCDKETPMQALVLAPTRELAIQITGEINELGRATPIRAAAIYGGERIAKQTQKLKQNPQIIVATPGRVMDMVGRGLMHFNNVRFAILDEVDRMLDIGFREDIRKILSKCPKKRQTIFVSATISGEIEKLARQYMTDPEKIVTSSGSLTVSLVEQHYLNVEAWDKKQLLLHLLTHEEPALTLVFCRLKRTVDHLAQYLQRKGIDAHAIHADLNQSKRNQIMTKFRSGKLGVLIASDLASRGIDVDGISHVINYDLPEDPDLYVHRIGRTARAGRGGVAWALVTPEQGKLLTQIELLINAEIPKLEYPDFKPGPVPEDIAAQRELDAQRKANITPKSRFGVELPAAKEPGPAAEPDEKLAAKFPGGVVPTKLPPKRMQGKTRGRRGR